MSDHRVLVIYPKDSKHINAWLSVNGKTRWKKKGAEYHRTRILEGKTLLSGWSQIVVRKVETSL